MRDSAKSSLESRFKGIFDGIAKTNIIAGVMALKKEIEYHKISIFHKYPDVMKVKDVMQALGIGRHTVYDLIQSNSINGFKLGKAYRITKKSLIQYILKMDEQGEK